MPKRAYGRIFETMVVRADIARLNELADKLDGLRKDIQVLSNNVVSASDSVLKRVNGHNENPKIKAARDKAMKSNLQIKELSAKASGRLLEQAQILRSAAISYRQEDRIDTVN